MKLHENQIKAIEYALDPYISKLFITGGAGTGKSEVIKQIVKKYDELSVNYTLLAPTNSASKNIGGTTLHSYFQITPTENYDAKKEDDFILFDTFDDNEIVGKDDIVLIVDEASMIGKTLLSKTLDSAVFTKLILVGDLNQLPPVKDKPVNWRKYCDKVIELTKNYRAKNELIKSLINDFKYSGKTDNIPSYKYGDFNENSVVIAFKNDTLSRLEKRLKPNNYNYGLECVVFNSLKINSEETIDNGDIITLGNRTYYQNYLEYGLTTFEIKGYDYMQYPPSVLVGDYNQYKKVLNEKFEDFNRVMGELRTKYKVRTNKQVWKLYKNDNLDTIDQIGLKSYYIDYIRIKSKPYARDKQFQTTYKAQGKSYKEVIVYLRDMVDEKHAYIAISRAMEKLTVYREVI